MQRADPHCSNHHGGAGAIVATGEPPRNNPVRRRRPANPRQQHHGGPIAPRGQRLDHTDRSHPRHGGCTHDVSRRRRCISLRNCNHGLCTIHPSPRRVCEAVAMKGCLTTRVLQHAWRGGRRPPTGVAGHTPRGSPPTSSHTSEANGLAVLPSCVAPCAANTWSPPTQW